MMEFPYFLAAFIGAACGVLLPVSDHLRVALRAGAREASIELFKSHHPSNGQNESPRPDTIR